MGVNKREAFLSLIAALLHLAFATSVTPIQPLSAPIPTEATSITDSLAKNSCRDIFDVASYYNFLGEDPTFWSAVSAFETALTAQPTLATLIAGDLFNDREKARTEYSSLVVGLPTEVQSVIQSIDSEDVRLFNPLSDY